MIARVFPSKTEATPKDALAFVGDPPGRAWNMGISEVHISVTLSWDIREANRLKMVWGSLGVPVKVGGPAMGNPGGQFVPGQFLAPGYVITSRGCPNHCWFCDVHKREGDIRELPIAEGHNILDSNLLACSDAHQDAVFDMLARQKKRPLFTGGLEAKRITPEIARKLRKIKTDRLYCAYDTPDDLPPLIEAGKMLREAGFSRKHHLYAYVLFGWPGDDEDKAFCRIRQAWDAGFFPRGMKWEDPNKHNWQAFARRWSRPAIARRFLP